MDTAQYVYVTYIASTPENIWNAITDPKITTKYWHHENISTWQPGAKWEHVKSDKDRKVLLSGKIIEVAPPKSLVMTWADIADQANPEKYSRVTINIEPYKDVVRLTVTHDRLEAGSNMHKGIQDGWPKVLSSLKSLLERDRPLPVLW